MFTVPSDDFHQSGLHFKHLLPAKTRLLFTNKHPVFGVEVCKEPWRDS